MSDDGNIKIKKTTGNKNDIVNYYLHPEIKEFLVEYPNPNYEVNQMKLPFMGLICAATGAGKSNMLVNLLKQFNNTFDEIYIMHQEEEAIYDFLKKMIKNGLKITSKFSELPSFEELAKDKKAQKLFIFDDMNGVKDQSYIQTLYKRGRKLGCSVLYLAQSFFDSPIFLRKQLHYLILLSISGIKDLNLILSNYKMEIDNKQLLKIFNDATKQHLDFLKIDCRTKDINKKFSRNFNEFYILKE